MKHMVLQAGKSKNEIVRIDKEKDRTETELNLKIIRWDMGSGNVGETKAGQMLGTENRAMVGVQGKMA